MSHPDLVRQLLRRQPERALQELDARTEYPETLGPDHICSVGGHHFLLIANRFACAVCGADATKGL